jgi:hypothetical protein
LLPGSLRYIPGLLLASAAVLIAYEYLRGHPRKVDIRIYYPILALGVVAVLSAIVNHQSPLNFLAGARIYFQFVILLTYILVMPLKSDIQSWFIRGVIVLAFLQILLVPIQRYALKLHQDLSSGTFAGTQRTGLFLMVILLFIFGQAMFQKKGLFWAMSGFIFIFPIAIGEAKAIFFFLPAVFIVFLIVIHKWITPRDAIIALLSLIAVNLISISLYPAAAQRTIIKVLDAPIALIDLQDRYSKLVFRDADDHVGWITEMLVLPAEYVDDEDYDSLDQITEASQGRSLGRVAVLKFAFRQTGNLSTGGYVLGAGMGSTLDSFMPAANGRLYDQYPNLELAKIPASMIFLDLGILGIACIAVIFVLLGLKSVKLICQPVDTQVHAGILGISLLAALVCGFIYTNYFYSEIFMALITTMIAIVLMANRDD